MASDAASQAGATMALTHVVVLKFKSGTDAAVKQQISTALGALPQKIPQIRLVPKSSDDLGVLSASECVIQ
jgi:hypothetical protein